MKCWLFPPKKKKNTQIITIRKSVMFNIGGLEDLESLCLLSPLGLELRYISLHIKLSECKVSVTK